jgi:DnaJ-class molecular chaperone
MAKKYHPDSNKDKDAQAKFVEVQEAYEILSDEGKRENYDRFGHAGSDSGGGGPTGAGGFGGFEGFGQQGGGQEDFFSDMFRQFSGGGGMPRSKSSLGSDLQTSMRISFMEAVKGAEKTIDYRCITKCSTCTGSGLKAGAKAKTCSQCGGRGQVVFIRGLILFLRFKVVSRWPLLVHHVMVPAHRPLDHLNVSLVMAKVSCMRGRASRWIFQPVWIVAREFDCQEKEMHLLEGDLVVICTSI